MSLWAKEHIEKTLKEIKEEIQTQEEKECLEAAVMEVEALLVGQGITTHSG